MTQDEWMSIAGAVGRARKRMEDHASQPYRWVVDLTLGIVIGMLAESIQRSTPDFNISQFLMATTPRVEVTNEAARQ